MTRCGTPCEQGVPVACFNEKFQVPAESIRIRNWAPVPPADFGLLQGGVTEGAAVRPADLFHQGGQIGLGLGDAAGVGAHRPGADLHAGQILLPQLPAVLGRQPGRCQILFPPETAGVSRLHCRLAYNWGSVLVTDLASRYGTYLDGVRLSPHVPAAWEAGVLLTLGSEKQALRLVGQAKSGEI